MRKLKVLLVVVLLVLLAILQHVLLVQTFREGFAIGLKHGAFYQCLKDKTGLDQEVHCPPIDAHHYNFSN